MPVLRYGNDIDVSPDSLEAASKVLVQDAKVTMATAGFPGAKFRLVMGWRAEVDDASR